jgi:hypothetical protein
LSSVSPRLVSVGNPDQPASSYANDPMTRLWRNAHDRETGVEAVEAIRARRQQQLEAEAQKQRYRPRFRRGRS